MDLGFSNELRKKISDSIPNIDSKIVSISISIDSKEERKYAGKYDYTHLQSNKMYAFNYFIYLVEIYNEIRYSAISAECCRELSKKSGVTKDDLAELGYRFKYYVDSAIYRYYSFWEIVGRFFNEYFDFQLEVNPKNYDKEKGFYFNREVLDKLTKEYDHKLILDILSYQEKSKNIFDYRTLKTHNRNTRIGEEILKLTKTREKQGRTLKFDTGKDFSFDDLLKLNMDSHKYSRLTLVLLRKLFDLKPDEYEMLKKESFRKSLLILPNNRTIYQFQKIVTCDSLILRKRK